MNTTFPFDPAISICSPAPPGTRFDIGGCYNRTLGCSFFPKVPIHKCEEYCGSPFGYYELSDVIETFITWVIPLFALLANMNVAGSTLATLTCDWPLRWLWSPITFLFPKHFVYSVQLANPIGTIWNLAHKLDLGQRLWDHFDDTKLYLALGFEDAEQDRARRVISSLCYCLDDFGNEQFESRVNRLFKLLMMKGARASVYKNVEETSRGLALIRIRNTLPTTFAVLVYVGAVVTSVLASTSSNGLDYSLPHTIALRELCFFVLAQVILSSAAGGWPQQWTPQDIMRKFAKEILAIERRLDKNGKPEVWEDLAQEEIELWDGGSYLFRPQKILPSNSVLNENGHPHDPPPFSQGRNLFLPFMAWFMVVVAFGVSFTMSWLTPTTGIGGRGLAEILFVAVWTLNFIVECCMTRNICDRRRLFTLIWVKDGMTSLLVLLFFFLPFIGWYNSCKSWSAWFSRWNSAYVDLNIAKTESWLLFRVYLVGAIGGSVAQVVMTLLIIRFRWWKAIGLWQRSDKENRTELCRSVIETRIVTNHL